MIQVHSDGGDGGGGGGNFIVVATNYYAYTYSRMLNRFVSNTSLDERE